jgi:hypothetical protein
MPGEGIRNLVVVSDIHAGCKMGLIPGDGFKCDDAGFYKPSTLQKQLWKYWNEFWDEWVPEATRGEPYAVCFNGDAIDGVHHGSNSQWTHNLEDQRRCAEAILRPVVQRSARYFHIRGTDAHVGASAQDEESLARSLGAIPNSEGMHARYDLWIKVGRCLGHILHHVGTTGSMAYEATAVHKELTETYSESARQGLAAPDFIIRSHRHRCIMTTIPTQRGPAFAAVTPCWQGKSSFVWKIPGGRLSLPQWGGLVVRRAEGEQLTILPKVWSPTRSRVER